MSHLEARLQLFLIFQMKLSLLCCVLLLVVPSVLLFPTKDETVLNVSESPDLADDVDDKADQPSGEQVAETNGEEIVTKPSSGKSKNDRRRPNKQQRIRNRYNQLQQNDKRHKSSKKHSPANDKKGAAKKTMKSPAIQYEPRSPYTDQLNSVVDDMLVHLSQAMLNDSYSTSKLRMAIIPSSLQVQPWAYVSEQLVEENGTEQVDRLKRDAIEDEEDIQSLANDDEEDDLRQEQSPTPITENKGTEDVDHDEEDEDEAADDSTKVTNGSQPKFQLTKKPSPIPQSDGSKLYKLQLVPEEKTTMKNGTRSSEGHHGRRQGSRKQNKHRQQQYRYPRRPNAMVEGLELIQRDGDVMIGSKVNSSVRIFDVRIQVGPIKFVLKESTDVPVSKSNVTSPILFARLRLVELEGKLVMARFKPTKISPNESVVTIRVAKGKNLPTDSQLATTVTHLSQELSRSWNTGYLLRRVKRQFKQLYVTKTWNKNSRKAERVHNEEAKKLTQAFLKSSQSIVPSTSAPLIVQ